MDCKLIRDNLADIVERKLPPETEKRLDAHLESCASCAALVDSFARMWQVWEQPERIEPSPGFWVQLQRRIQEREGTKVRVLPLIVDWAGWIRPVAAVAILVLGVLVGNYLGDLLVWTGRSASEQQQASPQAKQLFDYYLGGLDDFPSGSVGEFYVTPGNNT